MSPRYLLPFSFAILFSGACSISQSDVDNCEAAHQILLDCRVEVDANPFAGCRPEQEDLAGSIVSAYEDLGCDGVDGNSDRADGCFFCNEHPISELQTFTTDGCSAFPDGTFAEPEKWLDCCIEHDYAYFVGGSYAQREEADAALGRCVAEVTCSPVFGELMKVGVRAGGTPVLDSPWRWAYGWQYDIFYGYRDITGEHLAAAEMKVASYLENPTPPIGLEPEAKRWIADIPALQEAVDNVQEHANSELLQCQ